MVSSLIDTVRISVAIQHRKWLERQSQRFHAGEINPITRACASPYRRFTIPGAFGATATVWSKDNATTLIIECSLAKFLTGQNVFGSENLQEQVLFVVRLICKHLGIKPNPHEKRMVAVGDVPLHRLDLTTHLPFKTEESLVHFVKAMKLQLAFLHPFFTAYGTETLMVSQYSDNKSLKFYNKGRQLLACPLPTDLPGRKYVEQSARGLLRVELVLRRRYLKEHDLRLVSDWDLDNGRKLLVSAVADLHLRNSSLKAYAHVPRLSNLGNALLAAHMAGTDLGSVVPVARPLKERALAIRNATGIDLFIPFVAQTASADVDLESLAGRLTFGTDQKATELGITHALP